MVMSGFPVERRSMLTIITVLALLSVCTTNLIARATEEDLAKVRIGMDRSEVLKIMGKPDRDQEVRDHEEFCRLYVYKKVGRYKVVNIWFDCNDKVQAIDKVG
jgi:outer membrane protein assembly factor BamE (lipoprotein component of BamABCDE complex)